MPSIVEVNNQVAIALANLETRTVSRSHRPRWECIHQQAYN